MLPYIRDFTEYERDYFWLQCYKPTTLCKIAVVLRSEAGDKVLSKRYSKPHEDDHAEVTALNYITGELGSKPLVVGDDSSVLEVIIRLNNSPCFKCQGILFDRLLEIKGMAPKVHFRLILFFSNLYHKTDKGIAIFSQWVLSLVEKNVIVILCPLVVYKMVPKPDEISSSEVHEIVELGRDCINNFRELLSEIESYKGLFSVWTSHEFFRKDNQPCMRLFGWENPHFFSVFPKKLPLQLVKLFMESEFFDCKVAKDKENVSTGRGRKRPAQSYEHFPTSSKPIKSLTKLSQTVKSSATDVVTLPVIGFVPRVKKAKYSKD